MKKISLIMITFILALGLTGAGYAMWSDSIDIDASLNVGTVEAIFMQAVTNDPSSDLSDPNVKGEWKDWEPGTILSSDSHWKNGGRHSDEKAAITTVDINDKQDTLIITMNGAYVGYWGSVGCTIKNISSVPIKVVSVTPVITPPPPGEEGDLEVTFSGALDIGNLTVINPGEEVLGGIYFKWNSTPEKAAPYGLSVTIDVWQFNAN